MNKPRIWTRIGILAVSLVIVGLGIMIIGGSSEDGEEPLPDDRIVEVGFLTSSEIPGLLANGRYTMIEFGGRTCIPCKEMQPILRELKAAHERVIDIANFYLEDDRSVAGAFEISLMPTQIIFGMDGKEVSRHVGVWPKTEIEAEYRRLGIIE